MVGRDPTTRRLHGKHLSRGIHGLNEARRVFQSEATKDGLAAAVANAAIATVLVITAGTMWIFWWA